MTHDTSQNGIRRIFRGELSAAEARRLVLFKAGVFWGLIFLCWVIYPAENAFSIQTHTFSFLGSFEDKHNPAGWWLFTLAMCFWGVAMLPVAAYVYRRFVAAFPRGAFVVAALLASGGLGIALVGIFPDARGEVFPGWRWTDVHEKAAILAGLSFGLAVPTLGILALLDGWGKARGPFAARLKPRPLFWPFLFWVSATAFGVGVQIRWAIRYEALKAEAAATGAKIGSSWGESLPTWYSFPLWENLLIYTFYLFLCWLLFSLDQNREEKAPL